MPCARGTQLPKELLKPPLQTPYTAAGPGPQMPALAWEESLGNKPDPEQRSMASSWETLGIHVLAGVGLSFLG